MPAADPIFHSRPYRGVDADERIAQRRRRLLEGGLDILGEPDGSDELTVRAICRRAALAQRYFYESFTEKDEFTGAVYDWVLQGVIRSVRKALANATYPEGPSSGIAALVATLSADRRIGQILFGPRQTNPVVVAKRFESTATFVALFSSEVSGALDSGEDGRPPLAAHFLVGGVAQAIAAWVNDEVSATKRTLINDLTAMLKLHGVGQS
ncbi:putative transcriptional regulator [Mycolicibacterium conceptionense]|uniref:Putative transcriptional regulator n=1 Tax=Mycolicibacterium conceptionense TaxID=451644 RepID=A0A0U1DIJ3_9MYCO|nr:TetR/AcrR family transcriptional regulator [Mycolicibacterium conceptionense]ORV24627.1 hypothetical protein AWB98_20485 [Mycolicibacterium conceptionense]CQD16493.1 putative transcriptional regulator [Mycolicibacterium conceptionense]